MKTKAYFNWSGGKDSSLALYKALKSEKYEITTLLTSFNEDNMRTSMHGVHFDFVKKQAENLNIPLSILKLPSNASMEDYERVINEKLDKINKLGARVGIFGDIFLEDLREYREQQLSRVGFEAVFPLWKIPTEKVMDEFLDLGFKTIVTCVNTNYLGKDFVGRVIDKDFINDLPKNVDVCGENGEFHTFVFDGPIFKKPIDFNIGEKVYKEYEGDDNYGFWFCDIVER